jgi:hypothetical protein
MLKGEVASVVCCRRRCQRLSSSLGKAENDENLLQNFQIENGGERFFHSFRCCVILVSASAFLLRVVEITKGLDGWTDTPL